MFNKTVVVIFLLILLTKINAVQAQVNVSNIAQQCYTAQWSKPALVDLAKHKFQLKDDTERNILAMQLLNCLAIPNADIRDGVAFTGLSSWLRGNKLTIEVHRRMFSTLIENFSVESQDEHGVYQPFVALVLSELARVDRKAPYLDAKQRQLLVTKSTAYMASISDYRGFDEVVGWRHNVAHTADIFLQLALNPAITKEQLTEMLNAIGQQVLPTQVHFYTYGEPERLATAMLYILLQSKHTEQDWQTWLQRYISPTPMENWQQAYTSQQGLAKLHNARAFLSTVFAAIADSNNEQLKMLKPALVNSFDKLP